MLSQVCTRRTCRTCRTCRTAHRHCVLSPSVHACLSCASTSGSGEHLRQGAARAGILDVCFVSGAVRRLLRPGHVCRPRHPFWHPFFLPASLSSLSLPVECPRLHQALLTLCPQALICMCVCVDFSLREKCVCHAWCVWQLSMRVPCVRVACVRVANACLSGSAGVCTERVNLQDS